jgi:hypothetical protein
LVEDKGFVAIATAMGQAAIAYRRDNPPQLGIMVKPRWDRNASVLILGDRSWRFRKQRGPVRDLLDALEGGNWPRSVLLRHLGPDGVRDAGRLLRAKTMPHINWHAASDGIFSWETS